MLRIILIILQVISALGVITFILLQSGRSAGLSGSIAGGAEVIFGKKKGMDALFNKISTGCAISFMILTLLVALL
jgi:preprotein translocase subunit SecG